ncbi:MAG: hypothetical protein ACD_71C00057G0006 [uncultured bacterium (gcode 4)]|uniref:Abortive infection bacteriophage resistance protein n=1 Tax=uncultured bacterium (gcode 4) TaxID=1234023 RepID=K1ZJT8_9BACT|nr:MAG: hypothetical protein ACD_71C00057G0006 [uncultured bacterium (gcode 4)]
MKYLKPPVAIDKQILLLQSRWLSIVDEKEAIHRLEHTGYFRLSGYFKYYQNDDNTFLDTVTFEQVWDIYIFDRKLRLLTIDAIEKIEISLKANINYRMSLLGGCFWYKDNDFFDTSEDWKLEIYNKLNSHIQEIKDKSSAVFVTAYFEKYTSETHLPSWMLFEELTIGEVSNLYKILKKEYRQEIANVYGTYNIDLWKWIQLLVNLRNISAHHARLWNRRYISKPRTWDVIFKKHYQTKDNLFWGLDVIPNYYNASLIIHYLLGTINKNFSWVDDLENLFSEHPNIPKKSMWFDEKSFSILRSI